MQHDPQVSNAFTSMQRWVLGLAAAGSFMAALDAMVVTTALDTLRHDLSASVEALEWTVNAYTFSFAALLMTGAALGDRFGRRRMYLAGLALFALASAACALAPSTGWLVAPRPGPAPPAPRSAIRWKVPARSPPTPARTTPAPPGT